MSLNIYLDIDGVLLINENYAAPNADEFLQLVINKYPDSTFWLTTHCWNGDNRAVQVLSPHLDPKTVELLYKVKPTSWKVNKTEGIDFSRPFLWFDDDLWPEEKETLVRNKALDNYTKVDLRENPDQLKKLLETLPA